MQPYMFPYEDSYKYNEDSYNEDSYNEDSYNEDRFQ